MSATRFVIPANCLPVIRAFFEAFPTMLRNSDSLGMLSFGRALSSSRLWIARTIIKLLAKGAHDLHELRVLQRSGLLCLH